MIIWYGSSLYGKVDQVPGEFHVATLFGHVYHVPLAPAKSFIVVEKTSHLPRPLPRGPEDVTGIPIPLSWKSVLSAYVRAALAITMVVCLLGVVIEARFAWDPLPVQVVLLPSAALVLWASYRATQASAERAEQLRQMIAEHFDRAEREAVVFTQIEPEPLADTQDELGKLWFEHKPSLAESIIMWIVAGPVTLGFALGALAAFPHSILGGSILLLIGLGIFAGALHIQLTRIRFFERGVTRRTLFGVRQVPYDALKKCTFDVDDLGNCTVKLIPFRESSAKRLKLAAGNLDKKPQLKHVLVHIQGLIAGRSESAV